MPRSKNKQVRLGKLEKVTWGKFLRLLAKVRLGPSQAAWSETDITKEILKHPNTQAICPGISSKKVTPTFFAKYKFNADIFFQGTAKIPLIAGEAKKLTDTNFRSEWKRAIGQAFIYTTLYKRVVVLLYDYTTGRKFAKAFGPGNKIESSLARQLREHRIYIRAYAG